MKRLFCFFGVVVILSLGGAFHGAEAQAASSPVKLLSFEVGGLYAADAIETHLSGEVSWAPMISLGGLGLKAQLGLSRFKSSLAGDFFVSSYQGFLQFSLPPSIGLELGGGFQKWHLTGSDLKALLSGNVTLSIPVGIIDRIYVGYSRYFVGDGVNEVRFGVGLLL